MSTPEINLQLDNFLEQKGLLGTEKPAVGPAAPTIQQSLNSSLDSFLKYKGYELPGDLPNEKPPEPTPEMRGYMAKEFQPSKAQPSFVSTPSTTEGEPPKIEMTPGLEPTFWKQAKDLALAWAKGKIGPEDIGGVDLFKRLTLGNVDPYAIVEKISGKPGFKEMAETATRAKVVSAVGYEPKRAVAFSRGAAGAIGNVLAFAPILKGAQVTAKLLPAIPMLRAVARGVVAGALAGAIEKPEDEGAWNRLKQIPPNVLFFTAFETVGLAASQALKIFEWNLEYGKFRKGGPAGGQTVEYISKEVPGVGKTVGAENFTAQEMKDLFGKMQANVAGTGGEWSKVTPREQFVINEMAKPPGWKRAVKEGFFSEGTFIPGEPTTIYGAKVKPELVPRKPQMGDVFRNEAGLPKYQPTIAEQEMWPSRWPREGQPSPVEPPIPGGSAAGPTATPGPTPPPPPPSGAKAGPKVTPGVSGGEPRAVVPVGKTTINIRPQADGSIKVEVEPNQVPWPADELWIKAEEAKAAVAAGEETPTPPVPKPKKRWSDWNPPRADKYPARDRSEMTGLEAFRYDDKMGGLPRKGYVPPRSPKLSDEHYLNKEMREFYSDILRTGEVKWGDLTSEEVALLERIFEPEEIEAFKAKPRLGPHGETLGEFTGAGYQGADREQVREEYRKWYASMAKPKPPAQGSLFGAEVAQIPPNLPAERATAVVEPKTQAGGYTPTGKSLPAAPPEIKAFDPRFKEAIDLIDSTWTTDALIKERQLKRKLTGEELSVIRDAELKRNGIDPALPMEQWESAWMEKRGITQPQTPTGNIPAPKRISPKKLTQEIQSEPGYVYHATNEERLYDIADTGTLKTHKPHEFTDQSVWPDGSTQKRAYFSGKADIVWQFSPEGGKPVVIRTRGEGLKTESTGDIFSDKPLPTTGLEYLGEDGAWHPVQSLKQPATQPQPSGIPEAKPTVEVLPDFTESDAISKAEAERVKKELATPKKPSFVMPERTKEAKAPTTKLTQEQMLQINDAVEKNTAGKGVPRKWRDFDDESTWEANRQALKEYLIENYKANSVEMQKKGLDPVRLQSAVNRLKGFFQGGENLTRKAREAKFKTGQPETEETPTGTIEREVAAGEERGEVGTIGRKPIGEQEVRVEADAETRLAQRKLMVKDIIAYEYARSIKDPTERAAFEALSKESRSLSQRQKAEFLKEQGIGLGKDTIPKYEARWARDLQEHGRVHKDAIKKAMDELTGDEFDKASSELANKMDKDLGPVKGPKIGLTVEMAHPIPESPKGGERFAFDAETEARFRAAKKIPEPGRIQKALDFLVTVKHGFTRIYEHIPRGKEFIEFTQAAKNYEAAPNKIAEKLKRTFRSYLYNLNEETYDLVNRKAYVQDLLHEAEAGHELPFGFDKKSLQEAAKKLNELTKDNAPVNEALKNRESLFDGLRKEYAYWRGKVGFDVEDVLVKEDYVRHKVIEYAKEKQGLLSRDKRMKVHSGQDFLKKRGGSSMDILSDLATADWEVMARMLQDIEEAKFFDSVERNYNKADKFKAEAKAKGVPIEDVIPDGYTKFQPRDGHLFYLADTLPVEIAKQILEGKLDDMGIVKDKLRKSLAMGGKRETWIIPEEIAKTLDEFGQQKTPGPIAEKFILANKTWKQMILLWPRRFVKFRGRNITGDVDISIAGNPSGFRKVPRAVKETYDAYYGDRPLTGELNEYMNRGAFQGTLMIQELNDIPKLPAFKNIYNQGLIEKVNVPKKYMEFIKKTNNFSEGILRYAHYLDYYEQMLKDPKGRPRNFGASIPEEIMGLSDLRDRAFRLSNELMGAYNEVSPYGQALRKHIWPFWSWKETNFRRYSRLIANVANSNEASMKVGNKLLAGTKAGAYTALRVGRFAIKAFGLTAALAAWNNLLLKDEEADLPADVRSRPHLNFGRNKDGTVAGFPRLGAVGDFMEWFGLDTSYEQASDFLNGRRSIKEIALDMVKSPLNIVVSGISPFIKTPIELLVRRSLFPDALNPRVIRDSMEYGFRQIGFENEYKLIAHKPGPPYLSTISQAAYYKYDPLQSAYYDFLDIKRKYLKSIGKGGGGTYLSPSSNALYNMKMAHRYGETKLRDKYIEEYANIVAMQNKDLHGTELRKRIKAGLSRSLTNLHPLFGIEEKDWKDYAESLDTEAKDLLTKAMRFYHEVLLAGGDKD